MKENGIRNSFDSSSITLMEHYDKDGKEIKEQNVQKSEIEQHQDLQKSRIASIYK